MALSDHERRALERIEQSLLADDPKLGQIARSTDARAIAMRRLRLGAAVVVVGLVGLVLGVTLSSIVVGVLGFCVMFGGGVLMLPGLRVWKQPPARSRSGATAGGDPSTA